MELINKLTLAIALMVLALGVYNWKYREIGYIVRKEPLSKVLGKLSIIFAALFLWISFISPLPGFSSDTAFLLLVLNWLVALIHEAYRIRQIKADSH